MRKLKKPGRPRKPTRGDAGQGSPPGGAGAVPLHLDDRPQEDERPEVQQLFRNIRERLPALRELLEEAGSHWGYEDLVYRFYHQSFKAYILQDSTQKIVEQFQALLPGRPLNAWFRQIVRDGTGKKFEMDHNQRWLEVTRPIVEAFFHARYFLEMVVRYGGTLKFPPNRLPSGWASVLYLYDLR